MDYRTNWTDAVALAEHRAQTRRTAYAVTNVIHDAFAVVPLRLIIVEGRQDQVCKIIEPSDYNHLSFCLQSVTS
jgi:hypothetical protein